MCPRLPTPHAALPGSLAPLVACSARPPHNPVKRGRRRGRPPLGAAQPGSGEGSPKSLRRTRGRCLPSSLVPPPLRPHPSGHSGPCLSLTRPDVRSSHRLVPFRSHPRAAPLAPASPLWHVLDKGPLGMALQRRGSNGVTSATRPGPRAKDKALPGLKPGHAHHAHRRDHRLSSASPVRTVTTTCPRPSTSFLRGKDSKPPASDNMRNIGPRIHQRAGRRSRLRSHWVRGDILNVSRR